MIKKKFTGADPERAFELFRAVSDIDGRFVDESLDDALAQKIRRRRRNRVMAVRTTAAAAAVAVVTVGFGSMVNSGKLSRSKSADFDRAAQNKTFDGEKFSEAEIAENFGENYSGDKTADGIGQNENAEQAEEESAEGFSPDANAFARPSEDSAAEMKGDRYDENGNANANDNAADGEYVDPQPIVSIDMGGMYAAESFALGGQTYSVYSAEIDVSILGGSLGYADTAEYEVYGINGVSWHLAAAISLPDGGYALALSDRAADELPDMPQDFSLVINEDGTLFCKF